MSPEWKARLARSFEEVLIFSESHHNGISKTVARSDSGRVLLEYVENKGRVLEASIRLALPLQDELETLKVTCYALLFIKSLFPTWNEGSVWVENAANQSCQENTPITTQLDGYSLTCRWNSEANVIEYDVRLITRTGSK